MNKKAALFTFSRTKGFFFESRRYHYCFVFVFMFYANIFCHLPKFLVRRLCSRIDMTYTRAFTAVLSPSPSTGNFLYTFLVHSFWKNHATYVRFTSMDPRQIGICATAVQASYYLNFKSIR